MQYTPMREKLTLIQVNVIAHSKLLLIINYFYYITT